MVRVQVRVRVRVRVRARVRARFREMLVNESRLVVLRCSFCKTLKAPPIRVRVRVRMFLL